VNAGELERKWMDEAIPKKSDSTHKIDWMHYIEKGKISDEGLLVDWYSEVPGSQAPCHLRIASIQAMRNKGYKVEKAEEYIKEGLIAAENKDFATLQKVSAKINLELNNAPIDKSSPYHKYKKYTSWKDISKDVKFDQFEYDCENINFENQIKAGWIGQLIGGALGTQMEGFTKSNIEKIYGKNICHYLRTPETYNDDITYELVFLEKFLAKGYNITSMDIAEGWLENIADGYSAEQVALENLKKGIFPPESGIYLNYYSDWIGVQMRTPIHGMVCPGNPEMASKLAIFDGVISHSNSGIIGGMFNAILTSLSFVIHDMKELLVTSAKYLPQESEYANVVNYSISLCKNCSDWEEAWSIIEEKFKYYNWIHCYPNVAAQIIALWFGNNIFSLTTGIICGCGMDTDCTAGPVLNILAISLGLDSIDKSLIDPLENTIKTILRDNRVLTIDKLVDDTIKATRNANGLTSIQ
jgi:ADP-ribosylglycohydrolase